MPLRITPSPETDQPEKDEAERTSSRAPADLAASTPAERAARLAAFRNSRYEELDHTDLLHIIDELEGDRNWTSLREKLWIALIVHMLIAWYLFYGPKYLYHVHVVDPSVVMKQRQKDLTFLEMPPDALKPTKPKPTNIISDKDRVAQTRKPVLDRKTLEAMRRAEPPAPTPAPVPQQQQMPNLPPQPQPQVAQERPPAPPAQPLPQNNQARLEAPPPAPTPSFNAGTSTPGDQLQQAMRNAMKGRGQGQYGGDGGADQNPQHQGLNSGVDVLSDTMGWDWGPYVQRVIWDTKRAWYPIIPEEARPPLDKQGRTFIRFRIQRDGNVTDMHLEGPSGDVALDKAAWGGITGASPYPPLPTEFKGPYLELRFYFLYNIRPGDE